MRRDAHDRTGACLSQVLVGGSVATFVAVLVQGAVGSAALVCVLVVIGVLGMAAGRRCALAAALFGSHVFAFGHLADSRGLLGTGSVARAFVLVLALSIAVAFAGDAWWKRADDVQAAHPVKTM